MISLPLVAFNAGEFSPWVDGRIDLDKYRGGCRILENFLLTPYGGVRRRAGLQYVDEVSDSSRPARLLPFRFSTADTYVMVLHAGFLYIYRGGSDPMLVTSVAVPYTDAELFQVQYAQQNDVVLFTHQSHIPRRLTRTSATTFTLTTEEFEYAPMQDVNVDEDVTVRLESAGSDDNYKAGKTVTVRGVGTDFTPSLVGSRMRLAWERKGENWEQTFGANTNSTNDEIQVQGEWQVTTGGTFTAGSIAIDRWDDEAEDWEEIRASVMEGRNVSITGFEEDLVRMRVRKVGTAGSDDIVSIEARDGEPFGEIEITGWVSATEMTATVIKRIYVEDVLEEADYNASETSYTDLWSLGAFSPRFGYPACVCFHEGRLIYSGTVGQRQTIWGSRSDDYNNFRSGTEDDDAFTITLGSNEHNAIRWMVSERRLIIGTSGGEFVVGSSDDSVIITPGNARARRHSNFGSDPIQALFVNDSVIYPQRQGRKLREYGYVFQRDRYQASLLTILSEHITGDGIKELAYQQQRDAIVWAATENGTLIGMTYEREEGVVGWHRHVTDGEVESVETIYGESEEDEVWVIVKRTINGAEVRYIERMEPNQYRVQADGTKDDYFYVDAGKKVTGVAMTDVSLAHLEGETVRLLADGAYVGDATVTGGVAQLPEGVTASTVIAGLPMASRLEPMKLDISTGAGTSRTEEVRVNRVGISLWQSIGGKVGESAAEGSDLDPIPYRDMDDPRAYDDSPDPFTGDLEMDLDADYREGGATIGVVADSVYPLAVRMLIPKATVKR